MAPRRAKVNKFDYKNLRVDDVICPICRNVLNKPITLPCTHSFCSTCFAPTTQNANVVCPKCRVRVGSWLRSATKSKKIVNETFWQAIQNLFPTQIGDKLSGNRKNGNGKIAVKSGIHAKEGIMNKQVRISENKESAVVSSSNSDNFKCHSNDKRTNFLNNFATKEYTCRILCDNIESQLKSIESILHKKNRRIQELQGMSEDRSNSIESECIYFKPIDYRHNPPSEGLAPIKVPTKKPNINPHIKILAPSGQNRININHLESAFARLCSEKLEISKVDPKQSAKRKPGRPLKARKKVKTENQQVKSKLTLMSDKERVKRALQIQADYELAVKLQATFNQTSYPTRSAVVKNVSKNSIKMGDIRRPYKVK